MSRVIVYLDLVFLVNFLIDGALLTVTAWTAKRRAHFWRVTASAAVGALYALFMLLPELSFLFTFAVKFLFSMLMIWTAFGWRGAKDYLRTLGFFYLVNFTAAGGVLGVHYFLLSSGEVLSGVWFTHSGSAVFPLRIGIFFLFAMLLLVLWFYLFLFRSRKKREDLAAMLAEVEIVIGDFRYSCTGLIDTGNHLYDPLTRTPVMVVEAACWKEVLPESWLGRIRASQADQILMGLEQDPFPWPDRLRLVPYRGVNRGTQFMLAIKPDRVTVRFNGTLLETGKVLLGFDGGTLSADGTYQAILHPRLMEA